MAESEHTIQSSGRPLAPTEEARRRGASRSTAAREICEIDSLVTSNHFNIDNQGLNISSDGPCEISNQPTGQRIVGMHRHAAIPAATDALGRP